MRRHKRCDARLPTSDGKSRVRRECGDPMHRKIGFIGNLAEVVRDVPETFYSPSVRVELLSALADLKDAHLEQAVELALGDQI